MSNWSNRQTLFLKRDMFLINRAPATERKIFKIQRKYRIIYILRICFFLVKNMHAHGMLILKIVSRAFIKGNVFLMFAAYMTSIYGCTSGFIKHIVYFGHSLTGATESLVIYHSIQTRLRDIQHSSTATTHCGSKRIFAVSWQSWDRPDFIAQRCDYNI